MQWIADLFNWMGRMILAFFEAVISFVATIYSTIAEVLLAMLQTLIYMLIDLITFILSMQQSLVKTFVGLLPDPQIDFTVISGFIDAFPPDLLVILYRTGVPVAISIILGALVVRFLMGLVPFIRLGR